MRAGISASRISCTLKPGKPCRHCAPRWAWTTWCCLAIPNGGSIALLHAARHDVAGTIVMAPHVRVEKVSITSIEAAKVAYETTDLRARLAKYHDDVDGAFWGWKRYLAQRPNSAPGTFEAELASIKMPVLAMQGERTNEYGT